MTITAKQAAEGHDWTWAHMTDDERDEAAQHADEGGCKFCDPTKTT